VQPSGTVISDSVTAGVDDDETAERWPQILPRRLTYLTSVKQRLPRSGACKIMRSTVHWCSLRTAATICRVASLRQYSFLQDLAALLEHVAAPGRQVVMFELPLPPFHHEYGQIQRMVAPRYGVSLVSDLILSRRVWQPAHFADS